MRVSIPAVETIFHPSQLRVYRELARFSVLEIGRRWGKTTFAQQIVIDRALDGESVGWFAPTYRFLADSIRVFERALNPIIRHIDRTEKRIELRTGGVIEFWSCDDEDAGRGRSYDLVVVDEAGFVPSLLTTWQASIYPTLTDRRGSALFLGTPKGCGDFHRLYTQAEGDTTGAWRAFRIGSAENPAIAPEEIAMARAMLPPAIFAQEMEGVPAEDGGNPFGISAIRDCIGPLSNAEPAFWGVDLAKSQDWTVALALDSSGAVCRLQRWQTPWTVTRARLSEMIRDTPAQIDSTGVGDPICEDLRKVCRRAEGFKFTSQSKQQLMEGLQLAIQTTAVQYPDGWLRTELEAFGFRYSARGTVAYEATSGNDDGVCALALAVYARRAHRPHRLNVL